MSVLNKKTLYEWILDLKLLFDHLNEMNEILKTI